MNQLRTLLLFFTAIPICNTPADDCHEQATCADIASGEYTCTCNEGYTGDGKNCERMCF